MKLGMDLNLLSMDLNLLRPGEEAIFFTDKFWFLYCWRSFESQSQHASKKTSSYTRVYRYSRFCAHMMWPNFAPDPRQVHARSAFHICWQLFHCLLISTQVKLKRRAQQKLSAWRRRILLSIMNRVEHHQHAGSPFLTFLWTFSKHRAEVQSHWSELSSPTNRTWSGKEEEKEEEEVHCEFIILYCLLYFMYLSLLVFGIWSCVIFLFPESSSYLCIEYSLVSHFVCK